MRRVGVPILIAGIFSLWLFLDAGKPWASPSLCRSSRSGSAWQSKFLHLVLFTCAMGLIVWLVAKMNASPPRD
jgi:hypothetical protein